MQARIFTNDFNRIIDATKSFVATAEIGRVSTRYIKLMFDSVLNKMTAIAVDGYRLSVEHCMIDMCDQNFVAYIKPTIKLPRNQYFTITINEEENEAIIRGAEFSFGFRQPRNIEDFDYEKVIPQTENRIFRIGFNGNYLLEALKAAKVSAGNSFAKPIILEFWGETMPTVIRTNNEDIKMVLPVRIKDE